MKILDIPQSGKRGLTVSQQGRFGQISRALALVSNPRTPAQVNVRNIFASVTAAWRSLTQEQQLAWNAAAQAHTSTPRCGTSGPLTGFLFFNKINCVLATFGEARVVAPPAAPVFPPLAPTALTIPNAAGVIAIKLTCPTDPGDSTPIRAAAPQSAGRWAQPSYRILGTCPAAVAGSVDITRLYTARFGVPPAGSKVFVSACQYVDGFESLPTEFSAVVPAGA